MATHRVAFTHRVNSVNGRVGEQCRWVLWEGGGRRWLWGGGGRRRPRVGAARRRWHWEQEVEATGGEAKEGKRRKERKIKRKGKKRKKKM